jgi:hypothetical protein
MFTEIKNYLDGKAKGTSSMQITDDEKIVLFKIDYELDLTTNPPTVIEKPAEVVFTTTEADIDAEILSLQGQIETLETFKLEL